MVGPELCELVGGALGVDRASRLTLGGGDKPPLLDAARGADAPRLASRASFIVVDSGCAAVVVVVVVVVGSVAVPFSSSAAAVAAEKGRVRR